ncbi:exosome nuclease subunit [Entomophthora muscae]|uniref:Exosome nuclease subunit n=2 Tax=Entomophthora muscae TaxID=34485 RepID=A0ACC2SEA4_9FUNG|nr:exosome nuclease subunit [Entomophthora muscae]
MEEPRNELPEENSQHTKDVNEAYKSVVKLAKAVKALQAQDIKYHMLVEPEETASHIEKLQTRLLSLINTVLSNQGFPDSLLYSNLSQVIDRFDPILDLIDNAYERVENSLALINEGPKEGKGGKQEDATAVLTRVGLQKDSAESVSMVVARNLARPQASFADKVDNGYNTPFVSLVYQLGQKPNAMKPLSSEHIEKFKGVKLSDVTIEMAAGLPYPYQFEQDHIVYPDSLFQYSEPIPPRDLVETLLHMVTDQAGLDAMICNLKAESEIAIDLEHHDYRSFHGFVCLMQISTRTDDYIVDTLLLRRELFSLNEVFTDPKITKVFHGAESDIMWLQRDFGVYVVNMFDTYHASCCLSLEQHSLAYLMHLYTGVSAKKEYQMADWRVRPLPTPLLEYARADTHYLLYIFDVMRNELLRGSNPDTLNLLHATLDKSQVTASRRFVRTLYDSETGLSPGGWALTLEKCHLALSPRQIAAFRQLHAWRDLKAREEDESVRFILPNHMLFSLAFKMPTTTAGVVGCCEPVPIAVRMGAPQIAQLIADVDLELGIVPTPKRNTAASNLVLAETEKSDEFETAKQVNLPVATSLLGKTFKELNFPTPSTEKFSAVSNLFGAEFFVQPDESFNQEKTLRLALRDQVLASMDFCPLPPTVVIEAQLEDSRIEKGSQTVSSTAAPEGHDFVLAHTAKRAMPKGTVLVPSGSSSSRPKMADDVIAASSVKTLTQAKPTFNTAAHIEEYDYSNSAALVAKMTTMPASKKAKSSSVQKNKANDPAQKEPVYDPFGADLEKGSGAVKGARNTNSSGPSGKSNYSNRSHTFRR